MTRSELIITLATKRNLPLTVAERIISEIFDGMVETLIADERIEIRGFGSIENRQYDGHRGRNPKTGAPVAVKPKKNPFFKVGKELRERIMEGQ